MVIIVERPFSVIVILDRFCSRDVNLQCTLTIILTIIIIIYYYYLKSYDSRDIITNSCGALYKINTDIG